MLTAIVCKNYSLPTSEKVFLQPVVIQFKLLLYRKKCFCKTFTPRSDLSLNLSSDTLCCQTSLISEKTQGANLWKERFKTFPI